MSGGGVSGGGVSGGGVSGGVTGGVVRVVVADDHRLFRDGVKALLSVTPDLQVVGEAADADGAVALAHELAPDVILMDLQMPGSGPHAGGLGATERIAAELPEVRVLVLTMFDDDDSVFAALRAGARGYVLKDSEADDLVRAVRAAAAGEAIFGRSIAERLLTFFGEPRDRGAEAGSGLTSSLMNDLTPSERNVLRLMARGLNNPAIALELSYSHKTVRNYVSSVFRKLQVADRAQAIVRARDAGLHE